MQNKHWFMIVLVLVVGYLFGVAMPQYGQGIVSKIKGA